ncbi:MAG: alpha/beta hydrolase-fold protein [Bacteroidetes bacterium]|nr:alpha/beta hydrolase-fold protein [Bacteroidota bacterium]
MKKIILFTCILLSQSIFAGNFENFINYLNQLPENERQAKVDSFMTANSILPYIQNDTAVFFIYGGTGSSHAVAGDFTGWNPTLVMTGITGTNFFYAPAHYEQDARLDYKFVIDGNWILDPKNPYTCTGGYGPNSELRMPAYVLPPEIYYYPDIPHGTMLDTTFYSTNLSNSRTVKIYLPPGYSIVRQYPVIVFHDGLEYISLANTNNIFDYLIGHNEIDPVIGVFVPPVDRQNEYAGTKRDAFTAFIVSELMPVIDQKYSTSKDPRRRATLGASSGGNIALYLGMKHPETFGKIAAQSSQVQTDISSTYQNSPRMDLELYMDIGKYDMASLIPMVNSFVQILENKNYSYQFKQWNEGHSWGNWKGHLSSALRQFFPPGSGINEMKVPEKIRLYQNSPNPFMTSTTIGFLAPVNSQVELKVYDASGKTVQTLYNERIVKENNSILFTSPSLARGIYFYTLSVDQYLLSKKMTVCK